MRVLAWIVGLVLVAISAYEVYTSVKKGETPTGALVGLFAGIFALLTTESLYQRKRAKALAAPHDIALLEAFRAELPFNPTIQALRDQDFLTDYREEWLRPLYAFVNTWDDVHKEFLDSELEVEKKRLYAAAYALIQDINRETVPNDHNPGWRTVYPWNQRGGECPEHVRESARVLNLSAHEFVPVYESFVRSASAKLLKQA